MSETYVKITINEDEDEVHNPKWCIVFSGGGCGRTLCMGEVYGYASWSPRKGILVVRNPGDRPARFRVDLQSAFELPPGAPRRYRLESPWKESAGARPALTLQAAEPHAFELAPFEVLVLEAAPAG